MTSIEKNILDLLRLHVGEQNAIKDPAIRAIMDVPDGDARKPTAGLRDVINSLRQQGHPICSSTNGYWYAEGVADLMENVEALEGRANKIMSACRGMRGCLKAWVELEKNNEI